MQTTIGTMKSKINKGITTVSVKTSSSVEKAKLGIYMETVQNDMKKMKQELGCKVYDLWEEDNFGLEEIQADLQAIKEKQTVVDDLQKQIQDIEEQANSILQKEKSTQEQVEEGCVCSSCGSTYARKIKFCVQCGNKIS
jgi:peptidoglycan hydrolase CwlO-like protein